MNLVGNVSKAIEPFVRIDDEVARAIATLLCPVVVGIDVCIAYGCKAKIFELVCCRYGGIGGAAAAAEGVLAGSSLFYPE